MPLSPGARSPRLAQPPGVDTGVHCWVECGSRHGVKGGGLTAGVVCRLEGASRCAVKGGDLPYFIAVGFPPFPFVDRCCPGLPAGVLFIAADFHRSCFYSTIPVCLQTRTWTSCWMSWRPPCAKRRPQ